ncbi:SDR family oxidoreductase [Natronoarchaeum rubrum]|uniref:SDR family oxidoreductase n=1 Tax=Natronoarchaeum rubrum TaxID=755311 RepID=UPI0021111F45|nr:SDR family oxidoreductase [Natronoarchaeum rubrum]
MGESTTPPEIERDEIHTIDDDRFSPENVCIVTGAASGIGRAVTLVAAANGLTVVATDVDEDGLEGTADRAAELAVEGTVETVPADLRDDAAMDALVDAAAELGELRYLANVAGLQHVASIEAFPMERFDEIQDVMLRAPTYLAKRCLPHMREADGGCVGNMASVHGHYVTSDKVAYNVAKFGLRGLTQSIAAEGDGTVRSFSVSTGYVETPLVTNQIPDTAEQRGISEEAVVEDVMLGQARAKEMMAPVDVGNLFVIGFSRLARHLNGGDLLFDGGMTLTYD